MSGCPLEETVERGKKKKGKKRGKIVVLSFNVTWAWHSFTRLTCQRISIKATCDFLSHPYTSTSSCLRASSELTCTIPEANYHLMYMLRLDTSNSVRGNEDQICFRRGISGKQQGCQSMLLYSDYSKTRQQHTLQIFTVREREMEITQYSTHPCILPKSGVD